MACSKYQYVKQFEDHRTALLDTYLVARIDGRGFTKFCQLHEFQKPNDIRAIKLMNEAARYVCQKFQDIFLAYGQSDEYSFAFMKQTQLFNRRIDKIQSCIVSAFTAAYVMNWKNHFNCQLKQTPTFDCRIVLYPNVDTLKDYFKWRQVDCHINNLYNTVFWCLVKKGIKNTQVQHRLKDTNSGEKNQILFTQFNINYNSIDPIYRRGTVLCYKQVFNKKKSSKMLMFMVKQSLQAIEKAQKNTNSILSLSLDKKMEQNEEKKEKVSEEILTLFEGLKGSEKYFEELGEKYRKILGSGGVKKMKQKYEMELCSDDMIKEQFWSCIRM